MFFLNASLKKTMFYSFELQMAGVILLTAMAVCGVSLWIKRRKLEKESVGQDSTESIKQDVSENKWFNLKLFLKETRLLLVDN